MQEGVAIAYSVHCRPHDGISFVGARSRHGHAPGTKTLPFAHERLVETRMRSWRCSCVRQRVSQILSLPVRMGARGQMRFCARVKYLVCVPFSDARFEGCNASPLRRRAVFHVTFTQPGQARRRPEHPEPAARVPRACASHVAGVIFQARK